MRTLCPARFGRVRLIAIWLVLLLLAGGVAPARAAGTTWLVDRPGDDASDGDVAPHQGTLRFALTHAVSGDLVHIGDVQADKIFITSTLIVPAGVAVGAGRDQLDCGSYKTPRTIIEDSPSNSIDTIISLGVGATLRNVDIGGGKISVRITGADAEVCGVGLGVEYDPDGVLTTLQPTALALSIDGAHATIHRNYIGGQVTVTTHGSDTRIGDMLNGSGDTNAGVRTAAVTVLAGTQGAAQRVTIRDPFPRSLHAMPDGGIAGGDDDPTHANNWAQTPTIISAYTYDNFATVQVRGIASPHSLVDIFFDNQLDVVRQAPVMADATGVFSFTGALPAVPPAVEVIAASTLDHAAHPGRVGSSSEWSGAAQVTLPAATSIQLAPAALTFTAVLTGTPPAAQYLAVTAPPATPQLAWQTAVSTTGGLSWLSAAAAGSGNGVLAVTVDQSGLQPGTYTGTVTVFDPADPADRATAAVTLVALSAEPLLGALGGVVDQSGPPAGPAHPGDTLRFRVTMTNLGAVALTQINSTNLQLPQGYLVVPGSGVVSGGDGFVATEQGFSGGTLAPGTSATYALDVQVPPTAPAGMAVFSVEVNANGAISVPVVGRMRIVPPAPAPQQAIWLPLVVQGIP